MFKSIKKIIFEILVDHLFLSCNSKTRPKMVGNPELSIVVPFYSTARFIGCAAHGIMSQIYQVFLLVVVENTFPVGIAGVVKSFNDNRIKLLKNLDNRQLSSNRNHKPEDASNRFFAQFGSVKLPRATRFEKRINFLENNTGFGMNMKVTEEFINSTVFGNYLKTIL